MSISAERYVRVCQAYVQLADRFQQMDVEYMALKEKLIPILKTLKHFKQTAAQLGQEKSALEAQVQTLTAKYEELKYLELLLQPEVQAVLSEAEEQMEFIERTVQEIDVDSDPNLSDTDKHLLHEYYADPDAFSALLDDAPQSYPVDLHGRHQAA